MVAVVGSSTCTDTVANVCVGSATQLMDPHFLTLAQYQMTPPATFPACYGSEVKFAGAPAVINPQPLPPGFENGTSANTTTSSASEAPSVNDTCYFMLERFVLPWNPLVQWINVQTLDSKLGLSALHLTPYTTALDPFHIILELAWCPVTGLLIKVYVPPSLLSRMLSLGFDFRLESLGLLN